MSECIDPKVLEEMQKNPDCDPVIPAYLRWRYGRPETLEVTSEPQGLNVDKREINRMVFEQTEPRWLGPAERGTKGVHYISYLDSNCAYGNETNLTAEQVIRLQDLLDAAKPAIKLYVCKLNKTFTVPGGRMYFNVGFTDRFLMPFLSTSMDRLPIELDGGSVKDEVRFIKGVDRRATITTNWTRFLRDFDIIEGDIVAFLFEATGAELRLVVYRV